jgi:hypothetical protein
MKRSRRDSDAKSTAVVSTGRIERKRAHDREAQRASRAKTKAYIAHLEKTVADLTETSGDARANYLAQHATQQSQEIESLQGLVGKIKSLIQDSSLLSRITGDDHDTSYKNEHTSNETSPQTTKRADSPRDSSSPETIVRDDGDRHHTSNSSGEKPTSQHDFDAPAVAHPTSSPKGNLTLLGESLLCSEDEDTTYFDRLNRVLEQVETHPSATTGHISNSTVDQDILVRAILYGWDAAERLHHFDIVWRFLRAFDEGLWYRAGPLERLAHHWLFRNVMLHKMRPTNQPLRSIPTFMRPTQTQRSSMEHQSLADYYAWPKVRDLVIDRGGLNITGRTSIAFIRAIRFDWPYELRDAFHKNVRGPPTSGPGETNNGTFQLSGEFLKRFHWLGNFRLERPVEQLPLLTHFIPLHPAQLCEGAMPAAAMMMDADLHQTKTSSAATSGASLNSLLAWHDFRDDGDDDHTLHDNHPHKPETTDNPTTAPYPSFPPTTTSTQDLYATLAGLEEDPTAQQQIFDDGDDDDRDDDNDEEFPSTFPFTSTTHAERLPAASATTGSSGAGPSWAPSCSVDAASEAAFMEFAMEMWPVL